LGSPHDDSEGSHQPESQTKPENDDMKTYPCDECNLHLGSMNDLDTHISSFHEKNNQEEQCLGHRRTRTPMKCKECNITFETDLNLEWHIETNHELPIEMPRIACSSCDFESPDESVVRVHYQFNHKSPKVNITLDEQNILSRS
jgi:hypothetical protein